MLDKSDVIRDISRAWKDNNKADSTLGSALRLETFVEDILASDFDGNLVQVVTEEARKRRRLGTLVDFLRVRFELRTVVAAPRVYPLDPVLDKDVSVATSTPIPASLPAEESPLMREILDIWPAGKSHLRAEAWREAVHRRPEQEVYDVCKFFLDRFNDPENSMEHCYFLPKFLNGRRDGDDETIFEKWLTKMRAAPSPRDVDDLALVRTWYPEVVEETSQTKLLGLYRRFVLPEVRWDFLLSVRCYREKVFSGEEPTPIEYRKTLRSWLSCWRGKPRGWPLAQAYAFWFPRLAEDLAGVRVGEFSVDSLVGLLNGKYAEIKLSEAFGKYLRDYWSKQIPEEALVKFEAEMVECIRKETYIARGAPRPERPPVRRDGEPEWIVTERDRHMHRLGYHRVGTGDYEFVDPERQRQVNEQLAAATARAEANRIALVEAEEAKRRAQAMARIEADKEIFDENGRFKVSIRED